MGYATFEENEEWKPWGNDWLSGLDYLYNVFGGKDVTKYDLSTWIAPEKRQRAIEYAKNDIKYTYELWKHLGKPAGGDDDSELASLIGAMRWKGFAVAPNEVLLEKAKQYGMAERACPINCNSPDQVLSYIHSHLDATEKLAVQDTKKTTLEELARWTIIKEEKEICHPVVEGIKVIQTARRSSKRKDLLSKLMKAGRFTFSMKVLGTLSSRMAGGSEEGSKKVTTINPQGIPREKEFRQLFPLAFKQSYQNDIGTQLDQGMLNLTENFIQIEHLEGGDFDALEASIAATVYNDEQLYKDVQFANESGLGFHSITGSVFYDTTPEAIKKTKGTTDDKYVRSKNGVFYCLYCSPLNKYN